MTWRTRLVAVGAALLLIMTTDSPTHGDEGMWLFNAPPLKQLKERYNFEPTPQWLEHIQK